MDFRNLVIGLVQFGLLAFRNLGIEPVQNGSLAFQIWYARTEGGEKMTNDYDYDKMV